MADEIVPSPPRAKHPVRRVATVAAYTGGAIAASGVVTAGVLIGQAFLARITIPGAEAPPPRSDGEYGEGQPGAPLRLAVLGDSTAAGYGVATRAETTGALLASGVAAAARRPVRLYCPAVVGSTSAMLAPQVEATVERGVDLAVIMIGANDVTSNASTASAAHHLFDAVVALRGAGAQVVVATCPDLGTIQPIRPPLRWLARRWSRQLAAAQTVATVEAGGRTVSLGDLLGPEFAAAPALMFGADRFHPSAEGYRAAVAAVLPTTLAALGVPSPTGPAVAAPVSSLPQAAAAAAARAGTEVAGAEVDGQQRGALGRWAQLRRRVRLHPPAAREAGVPVRSVAEQAEPVESA
ncbi:SGNH/GDSL hydrolase family protein [Luedemannella helvata]|uniref:SGNH/GDSL hydrolase family protein n=2 Tax=Luedemannella helvata TaxID=349315 RepID=A0ABN2K156_9ACTN